MLTSIPGLFQNDATDAALSSIVIKDEYVTDLFLFVVDQRKYVEVAELRKYVIFP